MWCRLVFAARGLGLWFRGGRWCGGGLGVGWCLLRGVPGLGMCPAALLLAVDWLEAWCAGPSSGSRGGSMRQGRGRGITGPLRAPRRASHASLARPPWVAALRKRGTAGCWRSAGWLRPAAAGGAWVVRWAGGWLGCGGLGSRGRCVVWLRSLVRVWGVGGCGVCGWGRFLWSMLGWVRVVRGAVGGFLVGGVIR